MSRRRAFEIVDAFEQALCEYTGAPYCVATDSCTNALFLCFSWCYRTGGDDTVYIPNHTYIGVVQAARNAGYNTKFVDEEWQGSYTIRPLPVVDSAKNLGRDMFQNGMLVCLSFQAGKSLPIGRGGAILTDNPKAAGWFRKARLDGRTAGADYSTPKFQHDGWHVYMTPPDAARGLWLLTYIDDNDPCDWTAYPDLAKAAWD